MGKDERARVKGRLKRFSMLAAKKKNLELEKAHLEKELSLSCAPIARYGHNGGRGTGQESPTEHAAARHDRIAARLAQIDIDIAAVELDRQQVENALEALPDDEREVIKTLFFNGKSIAAACDELAYSERTIRRKTANALTVLAMAL